MEINSSNIDKSSKLNIISWNANSVANKYQSIKKYLIDNKVDILCLNETKLNKTKEAIFRKHLQNLEYSILFKSRDQYGGGVAIIISRHISFEVIAELDKFNCESLCIKIEIDTAQYCYLISLYNPPNANINQELFNYIKSHFDKYLICGDLDAKILLFGCNNTNNNGNILRNF